LPADVRWVGQADLLALIGLLPAVGRYADMFGSKLLDTYGFVIFILGSPLCGPVAGSPALTGFRALQSVT
jgi:MFS family permease